MSWLDDFMEYGTGGECPPKYIFWTGVVTIAACLRRKVWIDQINFQWTPNFYVLLVGPPGVKKNTSMNVGFRLLKRVPGINFGPQIVTWQRLIEKMANSREQFKIEGREDFEASCLSIKIGEFGMFFDPLNRELVDNMTELWDSAIDTIKKETRTMGDNEIVNPWLNIIAGTTPDWIEDNFTTKLIGSGFASRPVYVYVERPPEDVAYVSRRPNKNIALEASLIERLKHYAELSGEFQLTEEAYEWGDAWYKRFRAKQRTLTPQEMKFVERQQAHLHKLAMVLCVAREGFPTITKDDLELADHYMQELEPDVKLIFGKVGRTRLSTVACDIVEILRKLGPTKKSELYKRHFFRRMSSEEFEIAYNSVKQAKLLNVSGPMDDLLISVKED